MDITAVHRIAAHLHGAAVVLVIVLTLAVVLAASRATRGR
jgi:hypothetical protein